MTNNTRDIEILHEIRNGDAKEQLRMIDEKFPREVFRGDFPVRTLKENFHLRYNHFSRHAESLLSQIADFRLSDKIKWFVGYETFEYPRCMFFPDSSCQIQVSEKYFSYIWCATYCFFLHYEYQAQTNPEDQTEDELLITSAMLKRAQQLFKWSRSLLHSSEGWDLSLPNPNPTSRMIDSEAIYCLYTNKISINALVFILYHELGHSFYGRVYDIDDIKRYEQDADNFAVDLMKDPNEDNTFFSANFGIVVALCSNLFLHPTPLKLSSDSHPDTDVRILNAIDRIVEKGEWAYKNYLNFVAIIFRMFSQTYKIETPEDYKNHPNFETIEEAIDYFEGLFERFKD